MSEADQAGMIMQVCFVADRRHGVAAVSDDRSRHDNDDPSGPGWPPAAAVRLRWPVLERGSSVWPLTNQEIPNAKTASASKTNSQGQRALTEAGSRLEAAASSTHDKMVMPQAR
jgi:hypothetical protein